MAALKDSIDIGSIILTDVDYADIETRLVQSNVWGTVPPPSCEEEEQLRLLAETDLGEDCKLPVDDIGLIEQGLRSAMNLVIQSPSLPAEYFVSFETMEDLREECKSVESDDVHTGNRVGITVK